MKCTNYTKKEAVSFKKSVYKSCNHMKLLPEFGPKSSVLKNPKVLGAFGLY